MAYAPIDPFPVPTGGFGNRGGGRNDLPPDMQAKLDLMNAFGFGNRDAREMAPSLAPVQPPPSPIGRADGGASTDALTPPGGIGNTSANLQKIFAPAASQGPSPPPNGPIVRSSMSGSVPSPVAPAPSPVNPASNERQAQGSGNWGGIDGWLRRLMDEFVNNAGMGDDLKGDLRNEATQVGKFRERDRILRRGDDFAARGLFGSGLRKDAVMGIEGEESVALQGALNQIEFKDAEMKAQGLRDSIQVLNAMIAKKLGMGNLNIQRELLALERARFEFEQNRYWADRPPVVEPVVPPVEPVVPPPGPGGPGGPSGNPTSYPPNNYGQGGDLYHDRTDSQSELLRELFASPYSHDIGASWGGMPPWAGGGGGGGGASGWDSNQWWKF